MYVKQTRSMKQIMASASEDSDKDPSNSIYTSFQETSSSHSLTESLDETPVEEVISPQNLSLKKKNIMGVRENSANLN